PDNYQEPPRELVAHRTSPTNVGLLLCSTLAANDLGYLGLRRLADRVAATLHGLDQLERFRGHFFNWYDTITLKPLPPAYVSTVDSGTLRACLFGLRGGLLENPHAPVLAPAVTEGLRDALELLAQTLPSSQEPQPLVRQVQEARGLLAQAPAD